MVISYRSLNSVGHSLNTAFMKIDQALGSLQVSHNGHKITHGLWWHHLDLKINIYENTHVFQMNGMSTTPHSSFHHLHTHTHINYIYLYILLHMSVQEHVTSTTRGE